MIIRSLMSIVISLAYSLAGQAETTDTNKEQADLLERLQGKWNCVAVSGPRTNSEFTDQTWSGPYLRFQFKRNSLYVSQAPFDIGHRTTFKVKHSSIFVATKQGGLTEYEVNFISADSLVLNLRGTSDYNITYQFKKAGDENTGSGDKVVLYNLALVIFDHGNNFPALKSLSVNSIYPRTEFHYIISNQNNFYCLPSPLFNPRWDDTFATSFLAHFDPMMASQVDSLNNEMIIEFEVYNKRIANVRIPKSINYELSGHILEVLTEIQKHWRVTDETAGSKLRFSFSFFRGNVIDIGETVEVIKSASR